MENDDEREALPFVKSAYYTGKLLHASDFIRDQEYGNSKLEFVNRKFHGWGIIEGLEVRTGQSGDLYLSGGSAIDPQGRILAVPGDRRVTPEEIEGIREGAERDFILGICYAEQILETERDHVKKEERRQPSVIAETYALKAFDTAAFRELKREALRYEDILTEERVLYENGVVVLTVRIPKIVPADSLFRIRIQVKTVRESDVYVGWHGTVKLQGAVFAHSGEASFALEEEPAVCPATMVHGNTSEGFMSGQAGKPRSNKKPPASASGSIVTIFCFILRCHSAADQETESEDNPVCHREHGQRTRLAHSHGKKPCNFHW